MPGGPIARSGLALLARYHHLTSRNATGRQISARRECLRYDESLSCSADAAKPAPALNAAMDHTRSLRFPLPSATAGAVRSQCQHGWIHWSAALALMAFTACQPDPGEDGSSGNETTAQTNDNDASATGSTSGDEAGTDEGTVLPPSQSLFPLVDGAQWVYTASYASDRPGAAQRRAEEIVTVTKADESKWGPNTFVLSDSPDEKDEWTESIIWRNGSSALRIHKTVRIGDTPTLIAEYDPGFLRANDDWPTWTEGSSVELSYTRTASNNGNMPETRIHSYTVEKLSEMVQVPAGEFDCIKIVRERRSGMTQGEIVEFWYHPGVGKIKEHRPAEGKFEFLSSYDIPAQ